MNYHIIDTPVGQLIMVGDQQGVCRLEFYNAEIPTAIAPCWKHDAAFFKPLVEQLNAYFVGDLTTFDTALKPQGSVFQTAVWHALRQIPYGQTCSYADIAKRINNPKAIRAVGAANGRNPIVIIVPCHRVIGSSGQLTGYGGGLSRKKFLLNLEQANSNGVVH